MAEWLERSPVVRASRVRSTSKIKTHIDLLTTKFHLDQILAILIQYYFIWSDGRPDPSTNLY